MKPEWKKKWIDALRSGKYLQARGELRREGTVPAYCCLGVLCELGVEAGLLQRGSLGSYEDLVGRRTSGTILLNSFADTVGLPIADVGAVADPQSTLINMNDEKLYNFSQIADWIEKHL